MHAQSYRQDNYTLYCGDSREVLSEIGDDSIGLSVFSPPYYLGSSIEYDTTLGNVEYEPTWQSYLDAVTRVCELLYTKLVGAGRLVIVVDDRHTSLKNYGENICLPTHAKLICALMDLGYKYKDTIIWQKIRGSHASGGAAMVLGSYPYPPEVPVISNFEYILIFRKDGKREVPDGVREDSRINRSLFNKVSEAFWQLNGVKDKDHPVPFPIDIPARLIQLFSFVGDTVIDPFCGIGTTGLAAIPLGRRFIGIDISQNYIDVADFRLSQLRPMPSEPILRQTKMFTKQRGA